MATSAIYFYLGSNEAGATLHAKIKDASKKENMTPSEWLRKLVSDALPKEAKP